MLTNLLHRYNNTPFSSADTTLLDENTFYDKFRNDLSRCSSELIIESPFVTRKRLAMLMPALEKLKAKKVRIAIVTRDPKDQDTDSLRADTYEAIARLQRLGIQVIFKEGHHRKLAILDRKILYEGSLNILSQNNSREIMRRIESIQMAWQMIRFVDLDRVLN